MRHLLKRSIALVLLCSHLLTLTNCQNMSLPMEAENPSKNLIKNPITTNLLSDQVVTPTQAQKGTFLTLTARGGHQVTIENPSAWIAKVTLHESDEVIELPLTIAPGIDIERLSVSTPSYQKNRVIVCVPAMDPEGKGHVYIKEYGLPGGTKDEVGGCKYGPDEKRFYQGRWVCPGNGMHPRNSMGDFFNNLHNLSGLSQFNHLLSHSSPSNNNQGNTFDAWLEKNNRELTARSATERFLAQMDGLRAA